MKSINVAFLAACILASALVSCGSDSNTPGNPIDSKVTSDTEVVTEAVVQPEIPSTDYGGKEVRIQGFQVYYAPALYAEEENGDQYNDVLYQRIAKTEEYLNIDITFDDSVNEGGVATLIQNSVAAADDAIQITLSHDMTGNSMLVSQNLCYDLKTIESIDLNRDYWKLSSYEKLAVNGHIYLSKPAFVIPSVGCFVFDKKLMADYDITEPYSDVFDGNWTLDKMMEMTKIVTKDYNGDGKMDENDTYGIACGRDWQISAFLYSLGSNVTDIDDSGKIVLSLNTPHSVEIFSKMHDFLNKYGVYYDYAAGVGPSVRNNRALFEQTTTQGLDSRRDWETDYGVVPYPKWDEAQERYYGYDISAFVSIPSSVSDPEMVGKTLEVLNFYSRELVIPTYYDISLNTKAVRDEESIQVLDIIFNNIYCDAGRTYFGHDNRFMYNLVYTISNLYNKGTGDFASLYKQYEKGAQKCIDKFYDAVASND